MATPKDLIGATGFCAYRASNSGRAFVCGRKDSACQRSGRRWVVAADHISRGQSGAVAGLDIAKVHTMRTVRIHGEPGHRLNPRPHVCRLLELIADMRA
jgi:hypothetical protein